MEGLCNWMKLAAGSRGEHTSPVATMSIVSMTVRMGKISKSDGAPLGGSKRRPLGS